MLDESSKRCYVAGSKPLLHVHVKSGNTRLSEVNAINQTGGSAAYADLEARQRDRVTVSQVAGHTPKVGSSGLSVLALRATCDIEELNAHYLK
ncbi:hypothetical protein [Vreelandella alkaliphila]|uniref:Uncharacterized protein n=1 Tax=Vreelandella alkaliphila TaxID=272774 RepID=A0A7C9KW25_9GAMM|nr:hypothetical protein [Halomonas alkaliphila]NDL70757.1 hypothetical protein [Halomonas alkaliphila]